MRLLRYCIAVLLSVVLLAPAASASSVDPGRGILSLIEQSTPPYGNELASLVVTQGPANSAASQNIDFRGASNQNGNPDRPDFNSVNDIILDTPLFQNFNPFVPTERPSIQSAGNYAAIANSLTIPMPPPELAAIPIPGAVWLFSSGFLVLVGLFRKK